MTRFSTRTAAPHSAGANPSAKAPVRSSRGVILAFRLALASLVGLGGGLLPLLVMPPAAQAYTSRVNLFVVRELGESFDTMVQRSEIIARAAVQRSFDADVLMTDVIVTVIGDNQGIAAPILTVPVSRRDWQLRPDVTYWAQYFAAARFLIVE